jgi:hypothetical protein
LQKAPREILALDQNVLCSPLQFVRS